MATNVTYSSLFNDITVYLERGGSALTDPTVNAQIPRLINAAERKLAEALKLQGMIEVLVDPAGLQQGNPVVTKPDRWRVTVSMGYGVATSTDTAQNSWKPLFGRSYDYVRYYWPDATQYGSSNPPEFYADMDLNHWWVSPTPDQNYPLQVMAYMLPPLLGPENQSNFWSEYCGDALLYGAMIEALAFVKNEDRIPTFDTLWKQELQILSGQDLQKVMDRASERKLP